MKTLRAYNILTGLIILLVAEILLRCGGKG
jgi:hypothetical protein